MALDKIPQFNPFATGYNVGGVGGVQGGHNAGGAGGSRGVSGGSAVDRDIADAKRFFGAFNGTGELQPFKEEATLFYMA